MHSGTTTLAVARENHACMIIVGGWIMIIVETQLHSGNLESSQRNLEECAPYPKQRGPVSCDMSLIQFWTVQIYRSKNYDAQL